MFGKYNQYLPKVKNWCWERWIFSLNCVLIEFAAIICVGFVFAYQKSFKAAFKTTYKERKFILDLCEFTTVILKSKNWYEIFQENIFFVNSKKIMLLVHILGVSGWNKSRKNKKYTLSFECLFNSIQYTHFNTLQNQILNHYFWLRFIFAYQKSLKQTLKPFFEYKMTFWICVLA